MTKVRASYLFSGFGDYFGGHACDPEKETLVYAFYDHRTTVRDIFDQLIEDCWSGPASCDLPENVTDDDILEALLDCLTDAGRADYESGALSEFAIDYANANDLEPGKDPADDEDGDDYGLYDESPVIIFLLEYGSDDD